MLDGTAHLHDVVRQVGGSAVKALSPGAAPGRARHGTSPPCDRAAIVSRTTDRMQRVYVLAVALLALSVGCGGNGNAPKAERINAAGARMSDAIGDYLSMSTPSGDLADLATWR